jgi:hypothetical protein
MRAVRMTDPNGEFTPCFGDENILPVVSATCLSWVAFSLRIDAVTAERRR